MDEISSHLIIYVLLDKRSKLNLSKPMNIPTNECKCCINIEASRKSFKSNGGLEEKHDSALKTNAYPNEGFEGKITFEKENVIFRVANAQT